MIYLQQILLACLCAFILAATVAVVYSILILKEIGESAKSINHMVSDARRRFNALTGVLDLVSTFFGGVESAKRKISKKMVKQMIPSKGVMIGFFAGVKKGIKVLIGGEKE